MIKYGGELFSGVTYNQGQFSGKNGHLFILGKQQCNYGLSLQARNRIWIPITKWSKMEQIISNGDTCKQCAKNVTAKIDARKEKKGKA